MADINVGTMTLAQMIARIIEKQDTFEGGAWILSMIDALTAERDEARAVLKKVFDVTLYLPGAVTVTFDPVNPIVSMQARIDKARAEVAALKLKVKWFSLSPLSEEDVVGLKAIADSEGGRVRGTP